MRLRERLRQPGLRINIALLLAALVFVAAGTIWSIYSVFNQEIRRINEQQLNAHARRVAAYMQNEILPHVELTTHPELMRRQLDRLEAAFAELMRGQQSVQAVILSGPSGTIVSMSVRTNSVLSDIIGPDDSPQGYPINELLADVEVRDPDLITFSPLQILDPTGNNVLAYLYVVFDPAPPPSVVSQAVMHAVLRGLLVLLVVGLVLGVFLMQQRVARQLRHERDRAEHLAYVGTLAAGLAHEIRNPINALAMQLEMLEEDMEREPTRSTAGRIHRIRDSLVGIERTVSEFLTYATPGQQKPSLVDLESQLSVICDEFRDTCVRGQGMLECRIPPGLHAWCDVNALRQIMGNLLSNGWRAQTGEERRLRVEASRDGEWTVIAVEDAGPGVPEELRQSIFECFFSTSSDGTGLGLPIAQRLAEMNRGRLDLDAQRSMLGGARFVLRLPSKAKE